jgi:light-regulated signal transduction histidine kinase (bacteriophytochrome)
MDQNPKSDSAEINRLKRRLDRETRSRYEAESIAEEAIRALYLAGVKAAEANALVEAANRELESFSYSVAHDLRAPLRGMDFLIQVLLEDYSNQLDQQGQDYLQHIRRSSQTMAQLVNDLLRLSHVIRSEIHKEKVNFSDLAEEICLALKQTQPEREVKFKIAPDLQVTADEHLIKIAMENLLGNAWKFTNQIPRAMIEVGVTAVNDPPVFFIRDNGAGFNMAHVKKLFQPFERLHTQKEFPGTGIGLATVARIIHRHDGKIWPEGKVGEGATFYFTLGEPHQDKRSPAKASGF